MDENRIDPGHNATRDVLRVVGPVVALVGLGFMIVGFVDFASAFGGRHEPRLFWCLFVGMPLLFAGVVLSFYGYMGKVARYVAEEGAPVAKDTFNYMADGTKDGIKTVAGAIGQGLREGGFVGGSQTTMRCHKCNALAPADAKFCGQCGHPFG